MPLPEPDVGYPPRPALADMGRRYRLILTACPVIGVAALIALSVLGYPVAGAAFCVGLLLGLVNSRLVIAQAARFTEAEHPDKRALAFAVLQRLAALTAVALLVGFAFRPQGFAVLVGLAVFQLLMMGAASGALVRQLRG
jgi:uncharacterized membrane protein (DUF4010 family)